MLTGNLVTDILALGIPIVVALIMAILGLMRGVRREAIVSLSLILSALIVTIWVELWASDLQSIFSGFSKADIELLLAIILTALICLVFGYGLGSSLVPKHRVSSGSRLGGFLIGLANGIALSGWILYKYTYSFLNEPGSNASVQAALSSNSIITTFSYWAVWFPMAVAVIGVIVAIAGPFRKAQTIVATPSPQTNWQPSTAPAVAPIAPTAAGIPTSYSPQFTQPYAQQYGQQQYGQPQNQPQPQGQPYSQPYQQYPPQFGQQPQSTPPAYTQSSYTPTPIAPGQSAARVDDAPPTMPMPTGDLPRSPAASAETLYLGGMASPSSPTSLTQSGSLASDSASNTPSRQKAGAPDTGPLGDAPHDTISQTPAWAQLPDSSWLTSSAPKTEDTSAVSHSEAPTLAYPVSTSSTSPSSLAMLNCSRCGALVPGDATFCTECGNRMKT